MPEPLIDPQLVESRKHRVATRGLAGWPEDNPEDLLQINKIGLWLQALKEPKAIQHPFLPLQINVDNKFSPRLAYYFLTGDYEQSDLDLLAEYLLPGDRMLELGGGVGITASWAGHCSGQEVILVEPNRDLHAQIVVNLALNGQTGRVIDGLAVADSYVGESMTLGIHEEFWWSGAHQLEQAAKQVECQALKISQLLDHHRPSVLLVDIEGLETSLFPCRLNPELRLILVEIHTPQIGDKSTAEVVNQMFAMGLTLLSIRAHSWLFSRNATAEAVT